MSGRDCKSNSFNELSQLLVREQKLRDNVCRHSTHGMPSDGSVLVARGSRQFSLQSLRHYGSDPSVSTKKVLHESLSEGSLPQKKCASNISLNETATIPFGLLYELSELLNPLGHEKLNELAVLIGMSQEHFDKLYKAAKNPAISLLMEGERFLKSLENLKVALMILNETEAVDLIQKHQSTVSRTATTQKLPLETSTQTRSTDSDTGSDDGNTERPDFTIGDISSESVGSNEFSSGSDWSIVAFPVVDFSPDCIVAGEQSLPEHKSTMPVNYDSSKRSKSPSKEGFLLNRSLRSEVLQTMRSDGSQVDSGFGSAEHSAHSSESFATKIASFASDCVDGEEDRLTSESFVPNSDALCASDYISEKGGVLFIPNTNISLLVPEGALTRPEVIKLKVITNPVGEGCPQSAHQPRLTPLVCCEPDGLQFLKAAELTLPHCGIVPDSEESIEVYVRSGGKDRKWKRDEYASRNAVLNINTCSIPVKHFCDFDVFVRDTGGNIIGKKMRAFPMANCLEHSSDDILVSLWMCNDYNQEYDTIAKEKQEVTKVLLDDYNCYMLEASRNAVSVNYHNLSDLWTPQSHQEEIGYHQLWYGSKAKATFRMKCNTTTGGGKLNGTMTVKQKEHCETTKFELQYQVKDLLKQQIMQKEEMELPSLQTQQSYFSQISPGSVKSQFSFTEQGAVNTNLPLAMIRANEDEIYIPPTRPNETHLHLYMPSSSHEPSHFISPQSPPTFQVPYDLMNQLSQLLNKEDVLGNDWRILANDLGYTQHEISVFEMCKNPTMDMLQDACKKEKLLSFDQLRSKLQKRQRCDVVGTIDQYLKRQDTDARLLAIEGPQTGFDTESNSQPKLCQQYSGTFNIIEGQPEETPTRFNNTRLVQPLVSVQGTDKLHTENQQPGSHQSVVSGQVHNDQIAKPTPQQTLCKRGILSLPLGCTSTPIRLPVNMGESDTIHNSMKHTGANQGNDSGIDSPGTSRPPSRRRMARNFTLAPSFQETFRCGAESTGSGLAGLKSESPQNSHKVMASQSSSDDSGLAESPSSEESASSSPLDKLNKGFQSES